MLSTRDVCAGAALLLLVVGCGSTGELSRPTLTLGDAAGVVRAVPEHVPPGERPFRPSGDVRILGHRELGRMTQNPGKCGDGQDTPPEVCRGWSARIRQSRFVGEAESAFAGRRTDIIDTAFVFPDERGAERAFPVIKEIWTRGYFALETFPTHGLGAQETGLVGAVNLELDDLAVGYLWRVNNVILETFWVRAKQPSIAEEPRLAAAFRPYAQELNLRARGAG